MKIKKLSILEAQKIAAGQVVDRPANIVKELIENSIDADANNISIYLEDSGKKLIKVVDNGCGMSIDDAQLCFENHATSKINSLLDLQTIKTFGFRGEALASIAAVSQIKLMTKEENAIEGIALSLENNSIIDKKFIAMSRGTDIEVKNIFYNIPARLKFLKKDETELRPIIQIFQAFCLSYPNIHFKLFSDNKSFYNCPVVNDLNSRVSQLWDLNLAQSLIPVSITNENISIYGVISDHQYTRFNKNQIFFFVNKRWIKNIGLSKALLKGYLNVLPTGKFPAAKIFIDISTELIDINIHPKKEEVQFLNPKVIENLIAQMVKKGLENNLSYKIKKQSIEVKENNLNKEIFFTTNSVQVLKKEEAFLAATQTTFDFEQLPFFEPLDQFNSEMHPVLYPNLKSEKIKNLDNVNSNEKLRFEDKEFQNLNLDVISTDESQNIVQHFQEEQIKQEFVNDYEIIGQFKLTYILLSKEDGLFFIDQHAAHERILYELFSKRFNEIAKIQLIFPNIITLKDQDLKSILPHLQILQNNGIEAEYFGQNQIVIKSTPVHLKDISLENLIHQLISWIEEYNALDEQEFFKLINENLHAQMACKAAIKAGDKLDINQMSQLLKDLYNTQNCFSCPHGRPTGWLLSTYEIEKKFKRVLR